MRNTLFGFPINKSPSRRPCRPTALPAAQHLGHIVQQQVALQAVLVLGARGAHGALQGSLLAALDALVPQQALPPLVLPAARAALVLAALVLAVVVVLVWHPRGHPARCGRREGRGHDDAGAP